MKNEQILNQIRSTASAEYQSIIPVAGAEVSSMRVWETLQGYPTLKNEFINTLTNRVVGTYFFNKVFNNPLKKLHKGLMSLGNAQEQLFIEMVQKINFGEHFNGSDSDEGDLIKKAESKVRARYITKNFAYVYKISISEPLLAQAFTAIDGLQNLVTNLVSNLESSAEFDEFVDMKKILINAVESGKDINGNAITAQGGEGQAPFVIEKNFNSNPKLISEEVRALTGRLKFPSDKYNMAKVRTFTRQEDCILVTTPEIIAKLDVEVLANAFNVSSAEIQPNIILVDELPTKVCTNIGEDGEEKNVIGILMDKDFIQSADTIRTTRTMDVPSLLMQNLFLHKQGIMAECLFANLVVLVDNGQ